jgi:hypothetical protein
MEAGAGREKKCVRRRLRGKTFRLFFITHRAVNNVRYMYLFWWDTGCKFEFLDVLYGIMTRAAILNVKEHVYRPTGHILYNVNIVEGSLVDVHCTQVRVDGGCGVDWTIRILM